MELLRREPVAIMAIVQTAIACAVVFGLDWTDEQVAAVLALSAAVLAVVARRAVTPNASIDWQDDV
jgi:hypothetical protein